MKPELIPLAEDKANFGKLVKKAIRQVIKLAGGHQVGRQLDHQAVEDGYQVGQQASRQGFQVKGHQLGKNIRMYFIIAGY